MSPYCKLFQDILALWGHSAQIANPEPHTRTLTETESQQRGVQEEELTCLSSFFENEWLTANDRINFKQRVVYK